MSEYAIGVENIYKSFKLFYDKSRSLKDRVLFRNRNHYESREVLKGISFHVKPGEAIGLIGENGCGKSTMLKLLTRIMYPDSGLIEINGKVSSLLELGAGFHPDMTGRENIYVNASILGLGKREIDRRIGGIIAFSELGDYIDAPVRTYSSGMYMRLAFSVAINVDAEILLIDEILAVGDANFQAKCFHRLQEIKRNGTTIVIVSHSLGQIEQICDRSIWIVDGQIHMDSTPYQVHPLYLAYMGEKYFAQAESASQAEEVAVPETVEEEQAPVSAATDERWGNKQAEICAVLLRNQDGKEKRTFATGETMQIELRYKVHGQLQAPSIGIGVFRSDGLQCYGTNTCIDHIKIPQLLPAGIIRCTLPSNQLLPGEYSLDVAIHTEEGFAYDYIKNALQFHMFDDKADVGVARLEHQWCFLGNEGAV